MMKIKDAFGDYVEVLLTVEEYQFGGMAVVLYSYTAEYEMWEEYGTLTVNFPAGFMYGYGCVDTNNHPHAEVFISEYKLGEPTGDERRSGYCTYPLYKFNMDRLKEETEKAIKILSEE